MKRKSQVYGMNAFLYALAIGIILIVGIIGISKEFESRSQSGLYRMQVLAATKQGETIKKFIDSERGAVIDKSLYIVGAFGGYVSYQDLINAGNCTMPGCSGTCPTGYTCETDITKTEYGLCKSGTTYVPAVNCYPAVVDDTVTNPVSTTTSCKVKSVSIPYLGEKNLPYWRKGSTTCIPNETEVVNAFKTFAGGVFASPDRDLIAGLVLAAKEAVDFNYILELGNYSFNSIETSWYPAGKTDIFLGLPPGEKNVVVYGFQPYSHLVSNTKFFQMYNESANFIKHREFENYLSNPAASPIPVAVDRDYSVIKHYNNTDIKYPSGTAADPGANIINESFRALVEYVNNSANYPKTPNKCSLTITSAFLSSLSAHYNTACTVVSVRNATDGLLYVKGYSGACLSDTTQNKTAIMCVLNYTINKINNDLKLGVPITAKTEPTGSSHQYASGLNWRYEIFSFNITYNGFSRLDIIDYNATDSPNYQPPKQAYTPTPNQSEPDPLNCTEPVCNNPILCNMTTTAYGETRSCTNNAQCCGFNGNIDIGNPGLFCCNASNAHPSYKNKCQTSTCTGSLLVTYTNTPVRTYGLNIKVYGLCNGCTSLKATVTAASCFSGSVTTTNFNSNGYATASKTLTSTGSCTLTATVPGFAPATTTFTVADCGHSGEYCCSSAPKCGANLFCNGSNICVPCGSPGVTCCGSAPYCNPSGGFDYYCDTATSKCVACYSWLGDNCCTDKYGGKWCANSTTHKCYTDNKCHAVAWNVNVNYVSDCGNANYWAVYDPWYYQNVTYKCKDDDCNGYDPFSDCALCDNCYCCKGPACTNSPGYKWCQGDFPAKIPTTTVSMCGFQGYPPCTTLWDNYNPCATGLSNCGGICKATC